ncbi:DEAD/DEAH box helicase [Granulicella mallensis]|uniref:DEAD/H associated domain protein n=1 Tax=Granulicella mallensis (strain ATCC BAA-1857 / DSM 23137 / MP5ACTX8) TaxID=682795 RepID=G8NT92_GRAMM|nr:DEAD/DEAH box helicase [Granulicella mallensis]AEU38604.1 DEAD/H associated domain protein [Granulicella mallensis MP5ACTX8]
MHLGPPSTDTATHEALAWAHPVVQEWFLAKFGSPTEPQIAGWPAILRGEATLISAPTGSGKTLTAFLVCIDTLLRKAIEGRLSQQTEVVYVSPLKALSNDVQKNLDGPLAEIQQLALERGYLCPEIRTGVRTGDTLAKDRTAMLKHPPHILVTTPESLYILLTAGKPRENLTRVRTVIVDEIHAIADDKRGAHLALSLERLDALVCGENRLSPGTFVTGLSQPPQRIGLSATQNPIELVANFLVGVNSGAASPERQGALAPEGMRQPATIIQVGQRRTLDLALEVPSDELSAVTSTAMWSEIFDKLAGLANQHRSTLVFVNTRKLVEKISFELAQRLGEDVVAAHHGSLSRALRLDAEQRLKNGEIKILIATASLELGIDIGSVDLVCQIATTRAIAVAMQRVGRAGHWRGAIPKGRFFATTRDDLLEQAALLRKMVAGELDLLEVPELPIDVLMQQIVAACGAESWDETALYEVLRRAWPYRNLTREHYDELLGLLHNGIESSRGRYGAYLLRDRVQGQLHARRGARMIAISNGGAIPDTALYSVMLQPENVQIATLDEHFAVDSSPGDVVLLGNTSWRIQRVDPAGKVLVEDAHGAPPSIPFWEGEAPQRTSVLCDGVGDLRGEIDARTRGVVPSAISAMHPEVAECIFWLQQNCFVSESAALQLITYIVSGRAALGAVPTKTTIIAERFFDEGGGQQLILHAPFGGRINKAWGLALRKRFCRGFNFELQAAATDNGINISLAEQHSFPLADVFQFLTEHTAKELLEQASIPSPLFKNRWRWAAGRSLQLLRMQKGKRVAPQIQRTRSDDLLASVFPHASACPETMVGDIEIPDHPLVREVMKDTLGEAMDLEGLLEILRSIESGTIQCIAVDTPVPSLFAHELINAMPYAFLDEAGTEERRARSVMLRRSLPDAVSDGAGRLDQAAIDTVRQQLWPDIRDEHELHDLLLQLVALPVAFVEAAGKAQPLQHWPLYFERLAAKGRVHVAELDGSPAWIASERLADAALLWPEDSVPHSSLATSQLVALKTPETPSSSVAPRDAATTQLTQGWLQILGPTTAARLATITHLHPRSLHQSLLAMEMQGLTMRGVFEHAKPADDAPHEIEWCERRILQRIHRLTLGTLRKQVEPVAPNVFMRWLLDWHHVAPQTQLTGEEGVLAALEQLEGFEAPAVEWERTLLPARVANYDPRWLDNLCLAGVVGWGRISPHPAWLSTTDATAPRRVIPTTAAPITFFLRESAEWLHHALAAKCVEEQVLTQSLSPEAQQLRALLSERGAAFTADLQRLSGLTKLQTTTALWELATAGLASADGFDQLRAMMDPRRKSAAVAQTAATSLRKRTAARTTAGRWSLLCEPVNASTELGPQGAIARAKQAAVALDAHARILLCRYGVLFRDLLARESNAPKWRDLLPVLRRLEARGEIRGGRFVSGPFGEQYALPEAVESLRTARREATARAEEAPLVVAAADPLNLAGIIVPGERVSAVPGREVSFRNGVVVEEEGAVVVPTAPKRKRSISDILRAAAVSPRAAQSVVSPGLFP